MKCSSNLRITTLMAGLAIASPAVGAYSLVGSAADRATFLNMMNTFSTGGAWTQAGAANNMVFTANGGALNNFATRTKDFNTGAAMTLEVGRNQPRILVGGFMEGGVQRLDLSDIEFFASVVADKPMGDFQQAILLHEMSEVFIATVLGTPSDYDTAHPAAIRYENEQIVAMGGLGERKPGPDKFVAGNAGAGIRPKLRIPWVYHDPVGDINGWLSIKIGNDNVVGEAFIRNGLVDLETPFNPFYSEDIPIEDIEFEAIPAPGASALLGLSMGFAVRRRRNG